MSSTDEGLTENSTEIVTDTSVDLQTETGTVQVDEDSQTNVDEPVNISDINDLPSYEDTVSLAPSSNLDDISKFTTIDSVSIDEQVELKGKAILLFQSVLIL